MNLKKALKNIISNIENFSIDNFFNCLKFETYIKEFDEILNIDTFKNYDIIGVVEINKNLKHLTYGHSKKQHYIYFISNNKNKNKNKLYLSIGISHPVLWYSFNINNEENENEENENEEIKKIQNIINFYNPSSYEFNYQNEELYYIGDSEEIEINHLEMRNLLLTNYSTELLIWGNMYSEFPFRKEYARMEFSQEEHMIYNTHALQQDINEPLEINILTLFSKSKICIINKNNLFFVRLSYNNIYSPQINNTKTLTNNVNENMPIDLVNVLQLFNLKNYKSILNSSPVTDLHLYLATEMADNDKELMSVLESLDNENDNIKLLKLNLKFKIELEQAYPNDNLTLFLVSEFENNEIDKNIIKKMKKTLKNLDFKNKHIIMLMNSIITNKREEYNNITKNKK